jgi:ATP-binding cassette subfamily B protein
MQDRTVFVIAQRSRTVREADRIIFLENGRIAKAGIHQELWVLGDRYAAFYHQQFKG